MELPLSDHMRGLDPSQCRLGRMEGLEAKHRARDPLRANKSETSDSLKFTLECAGERFDGNARTSAHALAFLA